MKTTTYTPWTDDDKHTTGSGPIADGWELSVAYGLSGFGVYAHMTEYPEEGAVLVQRIITDPVATVQVMGTVNGREILGCIVSSDRVQVGDPLYAQPPGRQLDRDDVAVDRFAWAMKDKLGAARDKGRSGWETCPPETLSRMLREHVDKGDPRDVANFCMFLWNLGHRIEPVTPAADGVAIRCQEMMARILDTVNATNVTHGLWSEDCEEVFNKLLPDVYDLLKLLAMARPAKPKPLTDKQIDKINCAMWASCPPDLLQGQLLARAVERAHGIKGEQA